MGCTETITRGTATTSVAWRKQNVADELGRSTTNRVFVLRQIGMVALTGKMARLERSHPSRTLNSFSFLVKRQRFGCEIYLLFIKKQILAPKKKKKRKQTFIWG